MSSRRAASSCSLSICAVPDHQEMVPPRTDLVVARDPHLNSEGQATPAPARPRRQGSGRAPRWGVLASWGGLGRLRGVLAFFEMASSTPRCEIRRLMVHIYPGGIKAHDAERVTVFYGRRGRPVKKARFIPAERAHFWARRLQARRLGTVSVV